MLFSLQGALVLVSWLPPDHPLAKFEAARVEAQPAECWRRRVEELTTAPGQGLILGVWRPDLLPRLAPGCDLLAWAALHRLPTQPLPGEEPGEAVAIARYLRRRRPGGGRKLKLSASDVQQLRGLVGSGLSPTNAAKSLGIGRASAYRYLKGSHV